MLQGAGAQHCVCIEQVPLQIPFVVIDCATPARRLGHGMLTLPPSALVTTAAIELSE